MHIHKGSLVIRLSGAIPTAQIHWTVLLLAFIVTGFSFRPWAWLAVLTIILAHELGHAAAVLRANATVVSIRLDARGGCCEWTGGVTRSQRLAIAWGGVLAQLLLWCVAVAASTYHEPVIRGFSYEFLPVLLRWNLIMVAFNLIPIKPLDGYDAWRLLRLTWQERRSRKRKARRPRLAAGTLKKIEEMERLESNVRLKPEVKEMMNQIIRRTAEERKAKNQARQDKDD